MKLASGFCIPEPLPVHTGIKGRQVHPLIRFYAEEEKAPRRLENAIELGRLPGELNRVAALSRQNTT